MTQQHIDALRKGTANIKRQRDAAQAEAKRIEAERDAALRLKQPQQRK